MTRDGLAAHLRREAEELRAQFERDDTAMPEPFVSDLKRLHERIDELGRDDQQRDAA